MYWRIDCTEHLLLNIRDDPASGPPRAETNGYGSSGRPRAGRPRSTTYSSGSIGSAQSLAKHHHTVDRDDLSDSPSVVRWAGSPDGYLLAGVTRQGVYLWLVKPFVQLSSLVYDPVEELGQFVDVIWGDPSCTSSKDEDGGGGRRGLLFAVTSVGFIYEIAVYKRDTPALEYQFSAQHYYVRGPGEAEGIASLGLAQKRTYRLPNAGTAVCAAAAGPEMAMVSTRSHAYRLTWAGAVISTTVVRDIYDNPLVQVQQMLRVEGCDRDTWTELFLFSDGSVHLLSSSGSDAVVRPLEQPGIAGRFTVMAYNPTSRIVAAGTSSSEVLLYAMGEEGLELLAQRVLEHDKTAQVTALAWTPDGSAVACGYSTGHVVVRSVLGFELNATRLSSQTLADLLVPVPRLLHWAPGATRLYVLSDCVAVAAGNRTVCGQQGDVLPFVRAALSVVGCEGNSKRVCMFSDDKVFLHHCEFEAHDLASQQPELLWHVAHVPPDYISSNWPIRYVAADDDGLHIAVAGKNGLACYSVAAHKWRLFRNQQQEASISCVGGLLWYREYLIVASTNHECGDSPQILFFPRSRPLDTTTDLQTVVLESPVVTMSCHNSILLVLCQNNVLYQYAIFDDMNFIQVSFRREISLVQAGVDPLRVRSLQWVPSALFDGRPAFLVHEGIELKVIEEGLREQQSVVVVSRRVEFTITSGVNFGNMHSTVWWFSGTHLYASLISLEDFMDGGTGPLVDGAKRRMMRIRPEFFPVAISADKGMAVGIDQDWTLEEHAVIGLAKLPIRAKLYLHNILDHMLSDGAEQDALMYAACFEHLQFFPHAMEILLHEVLEREMDRFQHQRQQLATGDDDGAVLPRVVALLENFSAFHEIVVHCARKTEAAFWSHLFACVGGPEKFFRQCLNNHELETATQSLIILQTLEPASVNEDNILALLGKVVAAQNSDLGLEILRFLKMTAESDPTMRRLLTRLRAK